VELNEFHVLQRQAGTQHHALLSPVQVRQYRSRRGQPPVARIVVCESMKAYVVELPARSRAADTLIVSQVVAKNSM
jgi:hypothetical protein